MILLYYISLSVFIVYISTLIVVKGIPETISATAYVLEDIERLLTSAFTWFCWVVGITLLPYWLTFRNDDVDIPIFIACGTLLFVGAAPYYKEESQKMIHNFSAMTCAVASYVWLILYSDTNLTIASAMSLGIISLFVKKNKGFWLELIAFITIYIALR